MSRLIPACALGAALALGLTGVAGAATYEIDRTHSSVGFKVRHLGVGNVNGSFQDFAGTFEFDPADERTWKAEATIQTASITTGNERRDNHLRSADFFDAAAHPTLTFKSTGARKTAEGTYELMGDLTMRGVTKPVVLALELLGTTTDPQGNLRAGFSAAGKINRKDFGVSWSQTLDNGGLVVGEEVRILLEIEGVAKP